MHEVRNLTFHINENIMEQIYCVKSDATLIYFLPYDTTRDQLYLWSKESLCQFWNGLGVLVFFHRQCWLTKGSISRTALQSLDDNVRNGISGRQCLRRRSIGRIYESQLNPRILRVEVLMLCLIACSRKLHILTKKKCNGWVG